MSKSVKLKNNFYLDDSGIVHNRLNLKDIIDKLFYKRNDLYFGVSSNNGKYFKLFSFDINTWTNTFCDFTIVASNSGGGNAHCSIGIYGDSNYLGSNSKLYIDSSGINTDSIVAYQNGTTVTVYWYSIYNWTYVDFKLNHFHSTKNYSYSIGDGGYISSPSGTKMTTVIK